jgi:hypothetical protein
VRDVHFVTAVGLDAPSRPYGLIVDPLSVDHLLVCCPDRSCVFRMALADGSLIVIAGNSDREPPTAELAGPIAGVDVRFRGPVALATAPRQLWHRSDATALLMCDIGENRIWLIHIPY